MPDNTLPPVDNNTDLKKTVATIERMTKQAFQADHKFLAYLLEMAHIEAKDLLQKEKQPSSDLS